MFFQLLIILVLTLINGIFAMSEIALVSLNDNKVKAKAEEGDKKSKTLYNLLQDSNRFLSTIQIAITLAGFLSSAFASDAFSDVIANRLTQLLPSVSAASIKPIAMILVTLILSYFTLVLGELVPKRIGMNAPEKVSYALVNVINFISIVTKPIVKFLSVSTNFVVRLLGMDPNQESETVTEEEIRMMIDASQERGAIMTTEKRLIENIFEFDNTPVSDIMTHRTDMTAVEIKSDIEEVKELIFNNKFTRLPFYEDSIDNIIGILHLKDIIKLDYKNNLTHENLMAILRKPYFIPDSIECDELFFDLQRQKLHIAIVIDEYGGTAGLVTIEDLIEEIVGNIFDEYDDEEEQEIIKLEDFTYIMNGDMSLDNVENTIYDDLPLEDYDTLSGFIIGQLGRLPIQSDINRVMVVNNYEYTILETDNKVINKIKLHKIDQSEEE